MSRPLALSATFTVVAISLAVAPALYGSATYDPTVAVLTATLVAVIWYSLFTFRLAENAEKQLRVAEESLRQSREMQLSRDRRLRRNLESRVRTVNEYVDALPPYNSKILREIGQLQRPPTEEQLEKLTDLASEIGTLEDEVAGQARKHVRFLAQTVHDTWDKKFASGEGFPGEEWNHALAGARDSFEKLSALVSVGVTGQKDA